MSHLSPAGFFLLRTPALSWDVVRAWTEGLAAEATLRSGGDLEAAVAADEERLRARLRQIVERPEVREAVYVASPSLHARLQPWRDGDDGEAARGVEAALMRYVTRMAGRATPFGLFAGYGIGTTGTSSSLAVPPRSAHVRRSRLNLDVVYALAARASERAELRPHLWYRSNGTVYRVGERLRYHAVRVDPPSSGSVGRRYSIRELAASAHLEALLERGRAPGGATAADLGDALVGAFPGTDAGDARRFVDRLITEQLFTPTLLPPVTGDDPCAHLLAELRRLPDGGEAAGLVEQLVDELARLDAGTGDDAAARAGCERIAAVLAACHVPAEPSALLKVDLRKPGAPVTLSAAVLDEIAAGVGLVGRLAPDKESPLRAFARAFAERYQDREVPVLEALDPEVGIGFEADPDADRSSLIKGLPFGRREPASAAWSERHGHLLELLLRATRAAAQEIVLSQADVAALAQERAVPPPPGQMAVVTLEAESAAALDRGDYRLLLANACHTTTAGTLGRFLHDDPELDGLVRATLRREEANDPDAVHAEIAHHLGCGPMKGATNISRRPILRDYEIEVVEGSGAPPERRLALDDLLVSVRGGQVRLRSRTLDRRVIPHLSTAHAFDSPGLAIYRFLAHLQTADVHANVTWSWGPLAKAPFLPRVVHGRLVLALATWRLPASALTALGRLHGAARFRALAALRDEHRLPRHVCLVEGDNLLPIDLENALSIESLLGACKQVDEVVLRERFPHPDALVARGPDGPFVHELFVPIVRAPAAELAIAPATPTRSPSAADAPRALPGGEWLFAKIYCGAATADRVLTDVVEPLVRELRAAGHIDQWFYLRYMDPERHLRLRFRGAPPTLWREVAPRLFAALDGVRPRLHKIVVDTYDPEVDRYGGAAALPLAHRAFEADSDAALALVRLYRGDADARWRLALMGIDRLLDDLGLTLAEKREAVGRARDHWVRHFGGGIELTRALGDRFRRSRAELEALLARPPEALQPGVERLRARSAALDGWADQLRALAAAQRLTLPPVRLAESYLHMWVNRVLRGSANQHELVLYDLSYRLYDAALARGRRDGKAASAAGTASPPASAPASPPRRPALALHLRRSCS